MLISLGIFLLLLTILAITGVDKKFRFDNLLILFATFLQAFIILYFVHRRWHRFDLSFDAIVKFFSSGFLLATSLAITFEWLISLVWGIVFYILIIFDIGLEMPNGSEPAGGTDANKWIIAYLQSHVWLFAIAVFFNAFVVAALVEELCKYFAFWMVEHPDFMDEEDWNSAVTSNESNGESNLRGQDISILTKTQMQVQSAKDKSLKSKGAAITIAMVTVSLGFACCENLMYVFTGTSGASLGMGKC